jgi:hypothetical protein
MSNCPVHNRPSWEAPRYGEYCTCPPSAVSLLADLQTLLDGFGTYSEQEATIRRAMQYALDTESRTEKDCPPSAVDNRIDAIRARHDKHMSARTITQSTESKGQVVDDRAVLLSELDKARADNDRLRHGIVIAADALDNYDYDTSLAEIVEDLEQLLEPQP